MEANLNVVVEEAKRFISACYGIENNTDLPHARYVIWKKITVSGKLTSQNLMLRSLPPTDEAAKENILRAHYITNLWYNSLQSDPPEKDPCLYGWPKDQDTKTLVPVMVPSSTKAAPDEVLKMISCRCLECATMRCTCAVAQMHCREFCACYNGK